MRLKNNSQSGKLKHPTDTIREVPRKPCSWCISFIGTMG